MTDTERAALDALRAYVINRYRWARTQSDHDHDAMTLAEKRLLRLGRRIMKEEKEPAPGATVHVIPGSPPAEVLPAKDPLEDVGYRQEPGS